MDTVAAAPAVAASTSTERASSGGAPAAIALLKALAAGASASTIVLSPSRAAPGEVDAMIGVADRRVQLGQVIAVGLDDPGGRHDPGPEDLSVHDGSLIDNGNR